MSSRRTRKRRSNSKSNSRNRRTRQRGGGDQLFNPESSLIYLPEPTRNLLTPVENAEEYAKKAIRLINAGPELPEPTSAQKRKQKILQRVRERKERKERQRKFIPKPPSQTRRNVQKIDARKQRIKERLKRKKQTLRTTRKI